MSSRPRLGIAQGVGTENEDEAYEGYKCKDSLTTIL